MDTTTTKNAQESAVKRKDKIRKLLALASSPNEAEAKAALLKARELMAEGKLTEADIGDGGAEPVVKEIVTDVTFTTLRDRWADNLADVIAGNFCCRYYISRFKGCKTWTVKFLGLEDDVDACAEIYEYAVDYVRGATVDIKRRYKAYDAESIRALCNGYGLGFVEGLKDAYGEQDKSGWGLVLVVPDAVNDAYNSKTFRRSRPNRVKVSDLEYGRGYTDGKAFSGRKALAAG